MHLIGLVKVALKILMVEPVYVHNDDTLKTAFIKMYENEFDELPVFDKKTFIS